MQKPSVNQWITGWDELRCEAPGVEVMEQMFSNLPDVLFCIKNLKGQYLWANEAFEDRIQASQRRNYVGRTASEVFPPLLAAGFEQQDRQLIESGIGPGERLEMITNSDGSLGWFLSDKALIKGHDGSLLAIAAMSRDLKNIVGRGPKLSGLSDALKRMRKEYSQPLRIGDLAEEAGLSMSRFERLTRKLLHVSPRQYLTRQRVEAAARQLRDTEQKLADIAFQCGFCDQPSFSRQFKATTGMTPSDYRIHTRERGAG